MDKMFCGFCKKEIETKVTTETTKTGFTMAKGKCPECKHDLARVVGNPDTKDGTVIEKMRKQYAEEQKKKKKKK